jgi:WD40 repeat protein
MTAQKHFKAVVRARMARTGESYTAARAALVEELAGISLEPVTTIEAHDRHCIAVRFTPDGRELLTGGFSGQARVWSTADWSRTGDLVGHTESVNGFALDAHGARAVTVSSDRSIRLWDVPARRAISVLGASKGTGMAVDIRPDGVLAATGGFDGVVRFHAIDGGDAPADVAVGGRVLSVAFSPDGRSLAIASTGVGLRMLEPGSDGATEAGWPDATGVRWSPDGSFLVLTEQSGAVAIVDTSDMSEVRRMELDRRGMLPSAVTRDSSLIAIGWERHVGVWRADEHEPASKVDGLPKGVYALDFSPDGRLLAQGGADGRVRVWRVRRGVTGSGR